MRYKNMIIGIILIILGIVIDQVTKFLAFKFLDPHMTYSGAIGFKFQLVENYGAAWGILANKKWFLILVTFLALGFFGYLLKDFDLKANPIFSASMILIVAGTIGNFIDRVFIDYVRDFITFSFFDFPVFNFADMCLTVGVIFLTLDVLFGEMGKRWLG